MGGGSEKNRWSWSKGTNIHLNFFLKSSLGQCDLEQHSLDSVAGWEKMPKAPSSIAIAWFCTALFVIQVNSKLSPLPFLSYSPICHTVWASLSPGSPLWELPSPKAKWSASPMLTPSQYVFLIVSSTKLGAFWETKFCIVLCYIPNTLPAHCAGTK